MLTLLYPILIPLYPYNKQQKKYYQGYRYTHLNRPPLRLIQDTR